MTTRKALSDFREGRLHALTNVGVLLEPMKVDMKAVFAEMDRLRGDAIFPEGREQPPMQERDFSGFE